jgi:Protein of unknown function (DUF3592)
MDSLETIIGIVLLAVFLCVAVIFGGGLIFLLNRRNTKLRQAAQSWSSTTGQVIDSRVVPRVYFQQGITEAEAQARVAKMKEHNKLKPEDFLSSALVMFGPVGELAGDLIDPERTDGGYNLEEFPMIVYEYQVNGIKYISNRVRVQDVSGPTMGGVLYANPLLKRYPKGATVTVYYNPQNPKESALER